MLKMELAGGILEDAVKSLFFCSLPKWKPLRRPEPCRRAEFVAKRALEMGFKMLKEALQMVRCSAEVVDAASFGIDLAPRLQVIKVEEPPARAGGVKVGLYGLPWSEFAGEQRGRAH